MVIGFRSFSDGFAYVVLDGSQSALQVVAKNRVFLPKGESWPKCLSWVRRQLGEILNAYAVNGACIKTIEPVAKRKSAERIQVEAIIQEYLCTAHTLRCSVRIKSQLKRDIKGFIDHARCLDRVLVNNQVLAELNTLVYQEATLAAVSELPES
jgi:hypothetical protein